MHKEIEMKSGDLNSLVAKQAALTERYETEDGYALRSKVTGILKGLGFTDEEFQRPVATLSGGQKTRVALGKLLLLEPELLILDEPTNHLDLPSIAWLEKYLLGLKSALLIVSHDRYFLDKVAQKVLDLDHGKLRTYVGNYTDFAQKKEALEKAERKAYENQQQLIAHEQAVIDKLKSFNREKSIRRAESREKKLEKIEVLEKPRETREIRFHFKVRKESGNDVLFVKDLEKRFDAAPPLFSHLGFEVFKGEHVGIIGENGTGKTTLLKILTGNLKADAGECQLGTNVHIGYYDQEQQLFTEENTLFDEIRLAHPKLNDTEIRSCLARFRFIGEDVFKTVSALSGGERGRLALARLMLSDANFLILDEPTNHLDMASREVLETALNDYEGTVLYVSHDRYFINKTAIRILELADGRITPYLGNYDAYAEKKAQLAAAAEAASPTGSAGTSSSAPVSDSKAAYLNKKAEDARLRKLQKQIDSCEKEITAAEDRISEIDSEMALPEVCTDSAKLGALQKEKDKLSSQLETLYSNWEELSVQLS